MRPSIQWQTFSSKPIIIGDMRITLQSQALLIHWPDGGLVWNRPYAILIEQAGQTQRITIMDVTRMVQLCMWGIGLFCLILLYISSKKDRLQ